MLSLVNSLQFSRACWKNSPALTIYCSKADCCCQEVLQYMLIKSFALVLSANNSLVPILCMHPYYYYIMHASLLLTFTNYDQMITTVLGKQPIKLQMGNCQSAPHCAFIAKCFGQVYCFPTLFAHCRCGLIPSQQPLESSTFKTLF